MQKTLKMDLTHLLEGKVIAEPQTQKIGRTGSQHVCQHNHSCFQKNSQIKIDGLLENHIHTS